MFYVTPTFFFYLDLAVRVPEKVCEGKEVKLSCKQTCKLTENPTVIWKKNGEDLPVKQTHNYELVFQTVSSEDEGDYSCALKGHEGHPSKSVKLNVICEYYFVITILNHTAKCNIQYIKIEYSIYQ